MSEYRVGPWLPPMIASLLSDSAQTVGKVLADSYEVYGEISSHYFVESRVKPLTWSFSIVFVGPKAV